MPAVLGRLGEKVTGRALTLVVMIHDLCGMTRAAELPRGSELRDRRRSVAGGATLVCALQRRVPHARIGHCVARGARPVRFVVIRVALYALRSGWWDFQRHRRGVAFHTPELRVLTVEELHGPRTGLGSRHGDRQGRALRSCNLFRLMTGGALARCRRLVVADRTPARRLEGESPASRRGHMADEARKIRVPRVGEGIRLNWRRSRKWSAGSGLLG